MIYPPKLRQGSHIRVIAPSRSLKIISQKTRDIAVNRFKALGITVSFGKHAEEFDEYASSSVESRLADLHEAFSDKTVDGIFTAIGGYNCNEMLSRIDYDLIKNNPKILCGFSDITALTNAIFAKTGLVTYSGPHFSSFGMEKGFEYTLQYFQKCFMQSQRFEISPSNEWSNDSWYIDQENRNFQKNDGFWIINRGRENNIWGRLIGGNLGLLCELKGSPYFPDIKDSILFLEHCAEHDVWVFNRSLQSLIQHPKFAKVKALVIGRFEEANEMTREKLVKIIKSKPELDKLPVIANVDFGHTTPIISFPIGGRVHLKLDKSAKIKIYRF